MTNFLSVDFDRSKRHSNDGIYRKQIIKKMKTICSDLTAKTLYYNEKLLPVLFTKYTKFSIYHRK
jgi:hypothetical protein